MVKCIEAEKICNKLKKSLIIQENMNKETIELIGIGVIIWGIIILYITSYQKYQKSNQFNIVKKRIVSKMDSISKNFPNYIFIYWTDELYNSHYMEYQSLKNNEDDSELVNMMDDFYSYINKSDIDFTFISEENKKFINLETHVKTWNS